MLLQLAQIHTLINVRHNQGRTITVRTGDHTTISNTDAVSNSMRGD